MDDPEDTEQNAERIFERNLVWSPNVLSDDTFPAVLGYFGYFRVLPKHSRTEE